LPIRDRSVDLAVNLFTSFGYFASDDDHAAALRQMLATVTPGGWFVLDFLNAPLVRATVTAGLGTTVEGAVGIDKWLDDEARFVVKMITARDGRQFMERVRLFGSYELVAMIQAAGGEVRHRFGDYGGGPASDQSPRLILFAQVTGS
jgi:SAM-dependent methyltransferase